MALKGNMTDVSVNNYVHIISILLWLLSVPLQLAFYPPQTLLIGLWPLAPLPTKKEGAFQAVVPGPSRDKHFIAFNLHLITPTVVITKIQSFFLHLRSYFSDSSSHHNTESTPVQCFLVIIIFNKKYVLLFFFGFFFWVLIFFLMFTDDWVLSWTFVLS